MAAPINATKLAVLMIDPPPLLRIAMMACLQPNQTPFTLMSMVKFQIRSSVLRALSSSGCMIPALLNMMSSLPRYPAWDFLYHRWSTIHPPTVFLHCFFYQGLDLIFLGDICLEWKSDTAADKLRDLGNRVLDALFIHVGTHHFGTFLGKQDCSLETDTTMQQGQRACQLPVEITTYPAAPVTIATLPESLCPVIMRICI